MECPTRLDGITSRNCRGNCFQLGKMSGVAKVLYIVVLDDDGKEERKKESFSYTRAVLQSALQLMGCKARHAFKISQRVFQLSRSDHSNMYFLPNELGMSGLGSLIEEENGERTAVGKVKAEVCNDMGKTNNEKSNSLPFELYKRRTTVVIRRETFLDIVCDALAEYKYVGTNQRNDLILACRIRERKESVTVLLCGTSGCGKSTLSSLLGGRLGITRVLSTDSLRHMMRSFVDAEQNPLLWASTYHAGEFLDPVAVAEARAKKKANKSKGVLRGHSRGVSNDPAIGGSATRPLEQGSGCSELISSKQMAIEGFKAQSEMVIDSLDRLITSCEEQKESVVVEGVHLSLNFVMGLMKKHPSIIPFMIYIANEDKHMERFAVRAKYMTLDPAKNKYVKYIKNIRTIQEYLCKRADKHLVPKINNTNVDKSVAAIHATVFSCLCRRWAGEQLYDFNRNTVTMVDEEYRNHCVANSLSSKGMFQLIQRKGSSRNLMALVNTDGSVAKAWPVDSVDKKGKLPHSHKTVNEVGIPMYGPLEVGKAESVNLQFGLYGIRAWTNVGGTSLAGSLDESKGDATDTGSRYFSSCCSSPRMSDGPSKELKEDNSVLGSDEEIDDPPEQGSDEDFSDDGNKQMDEEIGSVDEESNQSDDEYDDLAMIDVREKGCWSAEDEDLKDKLVLSRCSSDLMDSEYHHQNPNLYIRNRRELSEPLCSYSSLIRGTIGRNLPSPRNRKMRGRRSLSIPALGKHGSSIGGPILSGAPQR